MENELNTMLRQYCVEQDRELIGQDITSENVDEVVDFLIYREDQTHGMMKCRETTNFLREWFEL